MDPFHVDLSDPDPGSEKSTKIMENSHKNLKKSQEYHILKKDITLLFIAHE